MIVKKPLTGLKNVHDKYSLTISKLMIILLTKEGRSTLGIKVKDGKDVG